MFRTLHLIEYIEPARRGITQPLIVRARDEAGTDELVYLKTRAGYADRPQAAGVEMFTTLMARYLGLHAPEPVAIAVPAGAQRMVHDAPHHAALLARSTGLNFGTVALGSDWKVWLPGMSTRRFPPAMVEAVLVFDGMVQHTDREAGNPNLMWKGDHMAVLDHEKVFGHLGTAMEAKNAWRSFFTSRPFARHVLLAAGQSLLGTDFGKEMWSSLLGMEFSHQPDDWRTSVLAAFPEAEVDLIRICAYLASLATDAGDFFDYLRHSLRP